MLLLAMGGHDTVCCLTKALMGCDNICLCFQLHTLRLVHCLARTEMQKLCWGGFLRRLQSCKQAQGRAACLSQGGIAHAGT